MNGGVSDATTNPQGRGIVLLTAGGQLGWSVANALARRLGPITMIEERPEPRATVLRRRARLKGWTYAIGQAATVLPFRVLGRLSRGRRQEIQHAFGLDWVPTPAVAHVQVPSVNSDECRKVLGALAPKVVAVYGTRLIRDETLGCVPAPFINYHAGINPKYRGQDPGYWALANGDPDNAGITVHLVDRGVDTGHVLYQSRVDFSPRDNITTYQWRQMGTAMPLFARAIEDALAGALKPHVVELPSHQWFPPAVWQWAWTGLTRGVW